MIRLRFIPMLVALVACTTQAPIGEEPTPTQSAAASSRFVPIRRPSDTSILEAPAVVRASSGAFGEVTAPAPLRIARIHVQVGQAVAEGDAIVDAYMPEVLDAAAAYLSTASRAQAHEERADQLEALLEEGLVGRPEVFEQRVKAAELRAARLRAIAILRSSGVAPKDASRLLDRGVITLTTPVSGIVTELSARVGRSYEPGTRTIARVLGEASARVEIRTAKQWPTATSVVFMSGDGREIALDPTPLASVVVPSDGTTRTWFAPLEDLALPDGLVGTARVSAADDVWEVPVSSIQRRGEKSLLLRQREQTTEEVDIEVEVASGASALVRGPLQEGDRVASEFPSGRPSGNPQ